jgi:predicted metallopeptidase
LVEVMLKDLVDRHKLDYASLIIDLKPWCVLEILEEVKKILSLAAKAKSVRL